MTDRRDDDGAPVVLFDWGETLMWIPGMGHNPARHLTCIERVFDVEMRPAFRAVDADIDFTAYSEHYVEAARRQIEQSIATGREHSFSARLGLALELAGFESVPAPRELDRMTRALGDEVVKDVILLDDAVEVVEALAGRYRLGVVSNYPYAPVVERSLARFGLREHFAVVVVSADTGWQKPHPGCFRPALEALPAAPGQTLFVGDSLENDVRGAKTLGLRTAWMAPEAEALPDEVDIHLQSLGELPAHCAQLFG